MLAKDSTLKWALVTRSLMEAELWFRVRHCVVRQRHPTASFTYRSEAIRGKPLLSGSLGHRD